MIIYSRYLRNIFIHFFRFFGLPVFRTFFYILLFTQNIFAQKNAASIIGKIITADGNPAYITVELKKLKIITVTDNNGNFKFVNLPALQDTLVITSIVTKTIAIAITLEKNDEKNLGIIRLDNNVAQLQDVEVTGRIAHSYKSDYSYFSDKTETPSLLTAQSISTITKELIKDKMQFTLKDAAGDASGVNQYSGYDEYTIRGFRAENAHDINGLRGYNTTYTSSMLVNIERVEIIKGPVATLYGNCDPGGTINLVTKKPLPSRQSEIDIYGGSWNHFRAEGDITGPLNKQKTLLYRFNAGYDNTNSFRNQFYSKSYQLAPSFTYIPNNRLKINIDFSLSHINTVLDRGQPGFLDDTTLKSTPIKLSITQPGDHLHETDLASIFTASYKINKNLNFTTGYLNYITQQNATEHGLNNYINNDSVYLYYSKWNYNTITNTITNYLTWQHDAGKINNRFLAGYDFIKSSVHLNQQYYELPDQFGEGNGIVGTFSLKHPVYFQRPVNTYQASDYDNDAAGIDATVFYTQGIYVQDEIGFDKWKLLLSMREEFYSSGDDDDDSAESMAENVFLPRIGVVYSLKPNISLYASYNNGFDPFEASSAIKQVFDEPFKPLKSELLEAGIKAGFFNNNLFTSLAVYRLQVINVAVNANDISNPDLFVQQGENVSKGIETELNGNIFSNLSVFVNYSYCVAKITKSKTPEQVGMLAENAPKNESNSWIKYTFNKGILKNFGISAGHSQAGVRNTLQQNLKLPSYIIINAGLHYSTRHFNTAINLYNFTNKTYWLSAYNNVSKWAGDPINFMITAGYNF